MSDREHNDEFRRLYDLSGMTKEEISAALGASLHTIISWLKPKTSKSGFVCQKWRVDMLKLAIDPKLMRMSDGARDGIFATLKGLRDAGVMSGDTEAAFEKMWRAHKRAKS